MSLDSFLALLVFALVGAATPGPNNVMLLASGVNFGFRRTLPHMVGIMIGLLLLLAAVGLGLGAFLTAFPSLHLVLKIAGGLYLLYLAWKIATARRMAGADNSQARPLNFFQAAAFQWVNPKAWVLGMSAMAVYTRPDALIVSVLTVMAAFAIASCVSAPTWTGFGSALRDFLARPGRLKWFNYAMGLLLIVTLVPMLG